MGPSVSETLVTALMKSSKSQEAMDNRINEILKTFEERNTTLTTQLIKVHSLNETHSLKAEAKVAQEEAIAAMLEKITVKPTVATPEVIADAKIIVDILITGNYNQNSGPRYQQQKTFNTFPYIDQNTNFQNQNQNVSAPNKSSITGYF